MIQYFFLQLETLLMSSCVVLGTWRHLHRPTESRRRQTRSTIFKMTQSPISITRVDERGTGTAAGVGETFVTTLDDTSWYVDSHHHVLKNRSNKIPESLEPFTGYNVPEVSKRRKRKEWLGEFKVSHTGSRNLNFSLICLPEGTEEENETSTVFVTTSPIHC